MRAATRVLARNPAGAAAALRSPPRRRTTASARSPPGGLQQSLKRSPLSPAEETRRRPAAPRSPPRRCVGAGRVNLRHSPPEPGAQVRILLGALISVQACGHAQSGSFGRRAVVEHPGARHLASWLRRVLSSPRTKGLQLCLPLTGPLLLPLPVAAGVRERARCGWRPTRCPWCPPGPRGGLMFLRGAGSGALTSRLRSGGR
jgi:hypothetical protein